MFSRYSRQFSNLYLVIAMGLTIAAIVLIFFFASNVDASKVDDYWTQREEFIKAEEAKMIGGDLVLSEKENHVNDVFMQIKLKEYYEGDPGKFIASRHIFDVLDEITKSEVFHFIKKLPKGALLHGHDTALASGEFLYNLTYSQDLYACYSEDERINLHFFKTPIADTTCDWKLISELRQEDANFDEDLKSKLTLVTKDYKTVHTNSNTVWSMFMDIFMLVDPLICYEPIFKQYFYRVFQELYEDNVMYIEFRSTLPQVYDLEGNIYDSVAVAGIYKEILDSFMIDYPDFWGAKLIYAPIRGVDDATMENYVKISKELAEKYPDFLAGFDLVGQEDLGRPLKDFIDSLKEINEDLPFYFHAGETNWYGTSIDFNLVDAVMLGTKRIGHGYAVLKHPDVAAKVKTDQIALEISPISNQVLMLIRDLRNHPGNYLMANNYPVVITNDDPSFWGTKALSHDWYMAFMGMASKQADLRFLKQLAINSIKFSNVDRKEEVMVQWEKLWDEFLDDVISSQFQRWHKNPSVVMYHH